MKMQLLAVLLAPSIIVTAHAEPSYRHYNGDGSNGTRILELGRDTYIRDRNGREEKCHEFNGKTICR